jgi:hypothetical protein
MKIEALRAGPGENQLSVELGPVTLSGRYEVYGLEQPKNTIDTGGMFAPLQRPLPTGTPDDTPPPLTVQQYEYLERADTQRTTLLTTPNGQTMISQYDEYSDIYTDVLNNDSNLQSLWNAEGATGEMMDWTYSALAPENQHTSAVNPTSKRKTFGPNEISYNYNAFSQKQYLAYACHARAELTSDNKYEVAGQAAMDFGNQVTNNTLNNDSTVNSMTAYQVFDTVKTVTPDPMAHAIGAQLLTALVQLVSGEETIESRKFLAAHGQDCDDDQLARLRMLAKGSPEKRRIQLWQDYFSVAVSKSSLVYDLTQQPNGAITVKLRNTTLRIPSLPLATGAWTGATGAIAAKRVQSARFLLGMLEDRLRSAVTRQIRGIGRAMATNAK